MKLSVSHLAAFAAAANAMAYDMTYSTTTTTITSCGPSMTCGASSLVKPATPTTSSSYSTISSSWSGRYPQSSSYSGWSSGGYSDGADPQRSSTYTPTSTQTWGAWPDPTSSTTQTSTSTTGWGDWSDPTTIATSTSTSTSGWGDWADPTTVTVYSSVATEGWGWASYTTDIVTAITTYCPHATEYIQDDTTYTVTSATTLTITDCPCTRTWAVYSASTFTDGYWSAIETTVEPNWTPTWTATASGWYSYTPVTTYTTQPAALSPTTTQTYAWGAATTAASYSTAVGAISGYSGTTPYAATYTGAASNLRLGGLVATAAAVLGLALAL